MQSYEIIDCHIHPFLSLEENLEWFSKNETPVGFVEKLKKAGISKACGTVVRSLVTSDFSQIQELNAQAVAFRNKFPDFYIPGIHIHPRYPEESCKELEMLHKEENVRWIGELVSYMMDLGEYAVESAFPIYDLAQNLGMPINIHPGELGEIEKICENFPRLQVVMAHPTSVQGTIRERAVLTAKYPELYLDISGGGIQRWGMLRFLIDTAGREKILFGTDFPIGNPAAFIQGALFENLTEDEFSAVFSGNFKRLTGL